MLSSMVFFSIELKDRYLPACYTFIIYFAFLVLFLLIQIWHLLKLGTFRALSFACIRLLRRSISWTATDVYFRRQKRAIDIHYLLNNRCPDGPYRSLVTEFSHIPQVPEPTPSWTLVSENRVIPSAFYPTLALYLSLALTQGRSQVGLSGPFSPVLGFSKGFETNIFFLSKNGIRGGDPGMVLKERKEEDDPLKPLDLIST